MTPKVVAKGVVLILTLAAIGLVLERTGLGGALDTRWIDAEVRGQGVAGELLFVVMGALFTGFGFPRQVVAFLGGYAFGFLGGAALALTATATGCLATFGYARLLGRDLVAHRFPGRVRRADAFLRDNPFTMTLLVRLLPVGSNLVTNLTAGVSSVPTVPFVAGSAVGYVPQTLIFALAGSGVALDPVLRIGLSVLLFIASGVLGVFLYRRLRHGMTYDEAIDRAIGDDDPAATGR